MGFNTDAFLQEQFEARTSNVKLEALSPWFGDSAEPVVVVRGLTFEELAKADKAAENLGTVSALINGLQSRNNKVKADAIRNALGYGDETPEVMVKRIHWLIMGSVEPEMDEQVVVKLANTFPIEFKILTDKVLELTGLGYMPGKQKSSGKVKKSKPA